MDHASFFSEATLIQIGVLIGGFTQQQGRRLRKRHLKSEFALPQTLSRLFHLV